MNHFARCCRMKNNFQIQGNEDYDDENTYYYEHDDMNDAFDEYEY